MKLSPEELEKERAFDRAPLPPVDGAGLQPHEHAAAGISRVLLLADARRREDQEVTGRDPSDPALQRVPLTSEIARGIRANAARQVAVILAEAPAAAPDLADLERRVIGRATITINGQHFAGVSEFRYHDPERGVPHGAIPTRFDRPSPRVSFPWVGMGDPIDLEATSEHDQRSST